MSTAAALQVLARTYEAEQDPSTLDALEADAALDVSTLRLFDPA